MRSHRRTLVAALAALLLGPLLAAPGAAATSSSSGEFVVRCTYDHSNNDDPPGNAGTAHLHDYFASTTTQASSTTATMQASGTSCLVAQDTAGYWVPQPTLNGSRLTYAGGKSGGMRIYYLNHLPAPPADGTVSYIPAGLKMIAGNSMSTAEQSTDVVAWNCGAGSTALKTPERPRPYDCTPYADGSNHFCGTDAQTGAGLPCTWVTGVVLKFYMPRCYDGSGLLPTDMVAGVTRSTCLGVAGHQWLPQVSPRAHYRVMNPCYAGKPCGPDTVRPASVAIGFSSGPYYTAHADFWNTWDQARLTSLTDNCLNKPVPDPGVQCGFLDS